MQFERLSSPKVDNHKPAKGRQKLCESHFLIYDLQLKKVDQHPHIYMQVGRKAFQYAGGKEGIPSIQGYLCL